MIIVFSVQIKIYFNAQIAKILLRDSVVWLYNFVSTVRYQNTNSSLYPSLSYAFVATTTRKEADRMLRHNALMTY